MRAIHHIRLSVSDLSRSGRFYTSLLSGLGFEELEPRLTGAGHIDRIRFRKDGLVVLIGKAAKPVGQDRESAGLHHLAFHAGSREEVKKLYDNVIVQLDGVVVEDSPVECPEYGDGYFATFFFDPDGIKLEITYTPD